MSRLFFSLILLSLGSVAMADFQPKTVDWQLKDAFIPVGFDNNDHVQAMVTGILPSTCYKVAQNSVNLDRATNTFMVKQSVYEYGGMCLNIFIPFAQLVDFGIVDKKGDYKVADAASGKLLGMLPIKEATVATQDDYLYAPVSDAIFRRNEQGGQEIVLTGVFTDSCLAMVEKDIRVDNQGKVLVVQPVATHEGSSCEEGKFRFTKTKVLPFSMKQPFLLHVRSMNGTSINKLIDYIE